MQTVYSSNMYAGYDAVPLGNQTYGYYELSINTQDLPTRREYLYYSPPTNALYLVVFSNYTRLVIDIEFLTVKYYIGSELFEEHTFSSYVLVSEYLQTKYVYPYIIDSIIKLDSRAELNNLLFRPYVDILEPAEPNTISLGSWTTYIDPTAQLPPGYPSWTPQAILSTDDFDLSYITTATFPNSFEYSANIYQGTWNYTDTFVRGLYLTFTIRDAVQANDLLSAYKITSTDTVTLEQKTYYLRVPFSDETLYKSASILILDAPSGTEWNRAVLDIIDRVKFTVEYIPTTLLFYDQFLPFLPADMGQPITDITILIEQDGVYKNDKVTVKLYDESQNEIYSYNITLCPPHVVGAIIGQKVSRTIARLGNPSPARYISVREPDDLNSDLDTGHLYVYKGDIDGITI